MIFKKMFMNFFLDCMIDLLGLKNIYSLINNINQDGGVDNLNDSPSGIDVINKPLSLENELFEEFCKYYEKLPHILPVKKRIICLGDLHGDYKLTLDCLKLANIILKRF